MVYHSIWELIIACLIYTYETLINFYYIAIVFE